jgi:rare lipoprotein A
MKKLLAKATLLAMMLSPFAALKANAPAAEKAKQHFSKPWYGMASWYGDQWNGRKTACGQTFDSERLTAAHPYLPCGTWVRITNTRTSHAAFARITDRGPYEEGREIDVSARVARRIDLTKHGVEKVKIEIIRKADE